MDFVERVDLYSDPSARAHGSTDRRTPGENTKGNYFFQGKSAVFCNFEEEGLIDLGFKGDHWIERVELY